ncbi:MAG TPA: LLM class F420-dependent oxidoreductase [Acidimicrobiales bacterium]
MRIGASIFPTDLSIGPVEVARAVEERGLDSLFVTEHTHIPTSRRTPLPGRDTLPDEYRRTLDPFVALGAAAAVTDRIALGTGITLVAQHDPIVLAKEVSTLDLVSNGRVILGIGVGWNVEEMEHHGVDPAKRRAIVREKVLAMKELWTKEAASFEGEHVRFSESWQWPKPVQKPHPPILMGGAGGPVTFRHVVEYCDGWIPISGRANIVERIADLRAAAEAAGRDPDTIELAVFGARADPDVLEHYANAGIGHVVLRLPSAPADVVLPVLDSYEASIADFRAKG